MASRFNGVDGTRCGALPIRGVVQDAEIGRGERIRTSGPCLPKTVLYQAELLPDRVGSAGENPLRIEARRAL
jgi:hypothetical protein